MSFKYEIKEQKPDTTVSIRTRTSLSRLPEVIRKSYEAIGQHLEQTKGICSGAPFAIYYNMDINDLDVELGFPVACKVAEKNQIRNSQMPAGKILTFTHVGPYNELEKTYGRAMAWMKENRIESSGIVCESYVNDPAVTQPGDLITEIKFYLKN